MGSAASNTGTFTYKRHEPEKTLLYRALAREWDNWFAERQADTERSPLPDYVEREFEAFFRCGRLEYGFVLSSCDSCGENLPVAFSCKKRGFCASCGAKRKSETAVHLIDNVLPPVSFRQWVTTFPHALRFWMAASRKLPDKVHQLITVMIARCYVNAAEEQGIKEPQAGGVTFVQRFGSALNMNLNFHSVAIDGVFSVAGPTPVFHQLRRWCPAKDLEFQAGVKGTSLVKLNMLRLPPIAFAILYCRGVWPKSRAYYRSDEGLRR